MTANTALTSRNPGRLILVAALYAGLLPVAVLIFFAVSEWAFSVVDRAPDAISRSGWIGPVLNYILPAVWGWTWYGTSAFVLRHYGWLGPGLRAHLVRTALLYGAAALSAGLLAAGWGTPDFGLYAQIPLWVGLLSLLGAISDLIVARSQRRSRHLAG